jgi:aminodeoxyfutalosine deaminase
VTLPHDETVPPGTTVPAIGAAPKIELHVHLEGAVSAPTLLEIARRNDSPLPAATVAELARLYEFTSFRHFIDVWILTTNALRTADDFRQITVDYAAQAASHGAVYLEAIFSPAERIELGIAAAGIFTGYCEGAAEAPERHGVTVRLTPDICQGGGVGVAEDCARAAVRYAGRGVSVSASAGWRERRSRRTSGPSRSRARAASGSCRTQARRTSALCWTRSPCLSPDRIRQGIRAADDPALLADLGREHEVAASLGVTPQAAYAAGLAGALCDEQTRARLAAPA